MTNRENQFGGFSQSSNLSCEACETMCLDAVDGTLTAAEQIVFDRHVAGCVNCAQQMTEAQRGAAWLEMLKGHRPEPPAGMMQRILAQTSEAEMSRVFPRHGVVPTPEFRNVVPARGLREALWEKIESTFTFDGGTAHFQPRMAMTAAMAFFSLALTLNLGGVRITDLRPGSIQRSFADAKASAARTIQNMRVVYQVESRVNDLRNDDRDPSSPFQGVDANKQQKAPATQPQTRPAPQNQQPDKPKADQDIPKGTSELIPEQTAPDADASRVEKGA